jgi:hypothetical protein
MWHAIKISAIDAVFIALGMAVISFFANIFTESPAAEALSNPVFIAAVQGLLMWAILFVIGLVWWDNQSASVGTQLAAALLILSISGNVGGVRALAYPGSYVIAFLSMAWPLVLGIVAILAIIAAIVTFRTRKAKRPV